MEPKPEGDKGATQIKAVLSLGPIWVMGWLFTVGFTHAMFWKGVLAVVIWPYYLGAALAR